MFVIYPSVFFASYGRRDDGDGAVLKFASKFERSNCNKNIVGVITTLFHTAATKISELMPQAASISTSMLCSSRS
jgi:hypothetical protein